MFYMMLDWNFFDLKWPILEALFANFFLKFDWSFFTVVVNLVARGGNKM